MEEKGTEQKPAEQPKVVVTNSMSEALSGFLPKNSKTLQEVNAVENKIVENGIKEAAAKKPEAEDKKEEKKPEDDKKPEDKKEDPAKKPEDKKEEKKPEDDKKPDGKAEEEDDDDGGVFGVKVKKGKKEPEANFEKIEDLFPQIKSIAGLDIKDKKELQKFFETVKTYRADSQALKKEKEEKEGFKAIFEGLPENFLGAIDAYYKGGDWKKAVGDVPKFDFNKPIAKQNVNELVKHYFPGKFKDEDFEAEEKPEALLIAEEASKDKFIGEQKTREAERAKQIDNANKKLDSYKQSVSGSVKHLKQAFPEALPEAQAEIVAALNGGPTEVVNMFFNKDGTCKEEAAELLMFAKHGKSELTRMMTRAARVAESKTNEDILTRGADRPGDGIKKEGNQGGKGSISESTKRTLDELSIFKTKKKF